MAEPPVIGPGPGLAVGPLGKHPPVNVFDQEGQGSSGVRAGAMERQARGGGPVTTGIPSAEPGDGTGETPGEVLGGAREAVGTVRTVGEPRRVQAVGEPRSAPATGEPPGRLVRIPVDDSLQDGRDGRDGRERRGGRGRVVEPPQRLWRRLGRADLRSVPEARRELRELLRDWGKPGRSEIAELLTSELVTNALVHTDDDAVLTAVVAPGGLRVEVRDFVPRRPQVRTPDPDDDTHGRGMVLVESLADAWGVRPHGVGKSVWFELGAEAA